MEAGEIKEKAEFEVIEAVFEADRTTRRKYWLWLKVRSNWDGAVEVRVKAAEGDNIKVHFDNLRGNLLSELLLGFHKLSGGVTELPPLPVWIRTEGTRNLPINIVVRSLRDRMNFFQVTQNIIRAPYLILGGKSGAWRR